MPNAFRIEDLAVHMIYPLTEHDFLARSTGEIGNLHRRLASREVGVAGRRAINICYAHTVPTPRGLVTGAVLLVTVGYRISQIWETHLVTTISRTTENLRISLIGVER